VGKRVPVPIFQAIDCFVIFGILLLVEHYYRDRPDGFVASTAVALWGLARFFEEHFWLGLGAQHQSSQTESHAGPILVQGAGLVMFGAGLVLMWWSLHKGRRTPAPATIDAAAGHDQDATSPGDGDPGVGSGADVPERAPAP
jgi:prolipoprotein diacylglyceryltransferase